MRIRLKAAYEGATGTGMYDKDGKEIPTGTELDVDESKLDLPRSKYDPIARSQTAADTAVLNQPLNKADVTSDGENPKPGAENASQAQTDNGTADVPTGAYTIDDKGGGWFAVTQNGEDVTKNFRKSDLDGFETMSDEDKAAFVDLHKKDA